MTRSPAHPSLAPTLSCALALLGVGVGCASPHDDGDLGEPIAEVDADTAKAALVIDGEITDLQSFESDMLGVFTLARIRVARVLQGELEEGAELVIEVRGGQIDDILSIATDHPTLDLGERARFYLDPLFRADAQAIAADAVAQAWAQGETVYGLRNGVQGMIELAPRGEPGLAVTRPALSRGCTAGAGFCFGGADLPYDFASGPYRYMINPNTSDTGGVIAAVQMGFHAWEAEPGSLVDFEYKGTTSIARRAGDGVNVVFWSSTLLPDTKVAETLVQTKRPSTGGPARMVGFDTAFNDNHRWGIFSDKLIEHTAMHEAGHALGFEHVADTNQVMFGSYQPTLRLGTGDREGVREWYRGPQIAAIGDFNGDDRDDIVTFVNGSTNGDVWVALQDTAAFRFKAASVWRVGLSIPGAQPLVGNFNGDSRDDIALVIPGASAAAVIVCTSTGSSFSNCAWWSTSFPNTTTQKVGDANGDGKDDLIGFAQGVTGEVYVALSNGSGFGAATAWYSAWLALGAETPEVGDIDADGDDNLIVYGNGASSDAVYVAKSNRSSFTAATMVLTNACTWESKPIVADFNGDGRADIGCLSLSEQLSYFPASTGGTFGSLVSPAGIGTLRWRNRTIYGGRFPTQGSIVIFTHCSQADVLVHRRTGATSYASRATWHDFFAPGPCP